MGEVVYVTIAVEDEKGNSITGKEVVDVTIAVEDEKGNLIAGKEVVDVTIAVEDKKGNLIAGKEVVDVTIALEDEKGNSIAGKEVVDVTIAVEDEKGNSIVGKEVVDVTIALEDEKGNFTNIISVAATDLYNEMLIFHQHCFSICCWSIHLNVNFSPAMFLLLLLVYTMTCLFFTSNVSVAVSDLYIEMLFFH